MPMSLVDVILSDRSSKAREILLLSILCVRGALSDRQPAFPQCVVRPFEQLLERMGTDQRPPDADWGQKLCHAGQLLQLQPQQRLLGCGESCRMGATLSKPARHLSVLSDDAARWRALLLNHPMTDSKTQPYTDWLTYPRISIRPLGQRVTVSALYRACSAEPPCMSRQRLDNESGSSWPQANRHIPERSAVSCPLPSCTARRCKPAAFLLSSSIHRSVDTGELSSSHIGLKRKISACSFPSCHCPSSLWCPCLLVGPLCLPLHTGLISSPPPSAGCCTVLSIFGSVILLVVSQGGTMTS